MTADCDTIKNNLADLRTRITAAAARAGRTLEA